MYIKVKVIPDAKKEKFEQKSEELFEISVKEKAKQKIRECDTLVDALIGYHLQGNPRGNFKEVIKAMNDSEKKIISYDVPSGIDATTGRCFEPCIRASSTLSLAMPKKLFETKEGRHASGEIFVADIGIPDFLYNMISPGSRPRFEDFTFSLAVL
mgnify:CR=1 FL=1